MVIDGAQLDADHPDARATPENEDENVEEDDDDNQEDPEEEQLYLYKSDPSGTEPVLEYEHLNKVKSQVDRELPSVKAFLEENPDASDDAIRWEVTDPSYYDLSLPHDAIAIVEFYAPWYVEI
jgi:hypothetical protein